MINKKILSIIPVAILICSLLICTNPASAYYGSTYGGYGGLSGGLYGGYGGMYSGLGGYGGMLGGMYGGMLGGLGMYGGMLGGLGMYGGMLGGMYGGMLGGMYGGMLGGLGMYGGMLGGLGMYGGMLGGLGMYGGMLGGMYGGMLGGLGMYGGLGGLYGGMLGGLGMYGGLGGLSSMLGTASLLSGLGLTSTTPAAAVAAEQTGTWLGTWTTAAGVTGDATLNVVEDPLTGAATGYLVLVFNTFVGAGTTVTGSISNNLVILGGSVPWNPKPVTLEISGWLITPDHMEGTYQITDYQGGSIKVLEAGVLELTLLPSLAVPVPAPLASLPAPFIAPVLATTPIALAPPTPILAPLPPPTALPVVATSPIVPINPTIAVIDPLATIAGGLIPFFPFFPFFF